MSEVPEFRERGIVAVHLLQGVIYEEQEEIWSLLLSNESDLNDYFCEIGLSLVIDRTEGMAYLRQFSEDERTGGYERLPRLFRKAPLTYKVTLLCVLLREEYRKFEEEDLDNERCVVEIDSLLELWKPCFPAESDEFTLRKQLVASFKQLENLKFVSGIKDEPDSWEVRKLLKARIPIEELERLRDQLTAFETE
ncbi:DUF4194 domain-containing protein [Gimesia sp.]|uniref:DUF4194 domain-containing protein n=1 Tax=Gimesia sp. TaxID=2024833 RepID=UPI000C5469E0|nr:DUF4194 domain-containing protein [Gimesia sp.]MAX39042.1 hypothetical protein [Gimesia sp.]HAH43791.1 hypothetical protein [Planctomycetaceae bacterium]|tara:strand:+ start:2519 stop:3100 length:582 start_codon:yes stop_codon:yes gene_type:complete